MSVDVRGSASSGPTTTDDATHGAVLAFWDRFYKTNPTSGAISGRNLSAAHRALSFFGPVSGRHLIDIGCGRGEASAFFASLGAHVTAIDISDVAVRQTSELAAKLGVNERVTAISAHVSELRLSESADFAFGIMILHHVEPFEPFAAALSKLLKPAGRAFFLENNATSRLLMWARSNLAGRAWIRKDSDPFEHPLTSDEVDILRRYFDVQVDYPEMVYLQLIASQALGGLMAQPLRALDRLLYRSTRLRRYSYNQYLMLSHRV
jgi:SAM-dependent methyltransferase